jgi:hypothetical protein
MQASSEMDLDSPCAVDPSTLVPDSSANAWHDDEGTYTGTDECLIDGLGHKFYDYLTFTFHDCVYDAIECVYREDKLRADAQLPCETYALYPGDYEDQGSQ